MTQSQYLCLLALDKSNDDSICNRLIIVKQKTDGTKKRRSKTSSSRALSDNDLLPITLFADKLLQIGVRTLSSYYANGSYVVKRKFKTYTAESVNNKKVVIF